jgi:hypothetical protein
MPSGVLRSFSALIIVVGLTGCFRSAMPLIDAAHAQYPFTTLTLQSGDGKISTVKRYGEVYRMIEEGALEETALMFAELGPDRYLVQSARSSGEAEYLFAQRRDKELLVRSTCRGADPALLARLGANVVERGETVYDCHFKDLQGLRELGNSPGLWDNSTTTLQIVSIE